ncbi:hypothetical protein Pcinc_009287 [Petrolisthes cinctipes]|uniref:Uncharacterized protein n=1 Tax=Petrolisthes cinctipes TaxID=88211 RepID=A0AAE1G5J4_PETCI|nr:hypothetical protein Pcinc_009287 [Petrolisthes cinctipes]
MSGGTSVNNKNSNMSSIGGGIEASISDNNPPATPKMALKQRTGVSSVVGSEPKKASNTNNTQQQQQQQQDQQQMQNGIITNMDGKIDNTNTTTPNSNNTTSAAQRGSNQCTLHLWSKKALLSRTEIPRHLQFNPYIETVIGHCCLCGVVS